MHTRKTVLALAATFLLLLGLFFGWTTWTERAQGNPQAVPLDRMELPAGTGTAKLFGIGEATHGNREFYDVKRAVLDQLIHRHGYRSVIFEADMGAMVTVDRYVTGGPGTAEEAASIMGYRVYANRQMADLLQWLREVNAALPDGQKVRVLGCDTQYFDDAKPLVLDYLAEVDPPVAERARTDLAPLTDAGRGTTDKATYTAGADKAAALVGDMGAARDRYVAVTGVERYELVLRLLTGVEQGARMQMGSDSDYGKLRDRYMAENTIWLADREATHGRTRAALTGHNGHLDKSGAAFGRMGYKGMGVYLSEHYAKDYLVIGTDFATSRFNSGVGRNRSEYEISVKQPYRGIFTGTDVGYVDFARLDETNRKLVESTQPMGSAGEAFLGYMAYLDFLHEVPTVPAQAYDGLVYVQHATPIQML